jgi:hypothetical protein
MSCSNCTPKSRKDIGIIESRVSQRKDRDFSIAIYSPTFSKKDRHILSQSRKHKSSRTKTRAKTIVRDHKSSEIRNDDTHIDVLEDGSHEQVRKYRRNKLSTKPVGKFVDISDYPRMLVTFGEIEKTYIYNCGKITFGDSVKYGYMFDKLLRKSDKTICENNHHLSKITQIIDNTSHTNFDVIYNIGIYQLTDMIKIQIWDSDNVEYLGRVFIRININKQKNGFVVSYFCEKKYSSKLFYFINGTIQ